MSAGRAPGKICDICCGVDRGKNVLPGQAYTMDVLEEDVCAYCWGPELIKTDYPPIPDFLVSYEWIDRYRKFISEYPRHPVP